MSEAALQLKDLRVREGGARALLARAQQRRRVVQRRTAGHQVTVVIQHPAGSAAAHSSCPSTIAIVTSFSLTQFQLNSIQLANDKLQSIHFCIDTFNQCNHYNTSSHIPETILGEFTFISEDSLESIPNICPSACACLITVFLCNSISLINLSCSAASSA